MINRITSKILYTLRTNVDFVRRALFVYYRYKNHYAYEPPTLDRRSEEVHVFSISAEEGNIVQGLSLYYTYRLPIGIWCSYMYLFTIKFFHQNEIITDFTTITYYRHPAIRQPSVLYLLRYFLCIVTKLGNNNNTTLFTMN